ncbi:MliC family protein [Methylobacterium sp. NEAU 140]|uniref:MliC family protein n=1 Tax=Methylobacterium sp. NEAU 140 TaxID=3064945 RepID=UPI002735FD2B|nr:MliC family protein [Methylobacterium sp. NEAU 140]MDP4022319.1 MliC family protein [Methylobacterium sp. NEAU 140]
MLRVIAVLAVAVSSPAAAAQSVAFRCPGGATLVAQFDAANPQAPATVRPPAGPELTLAAQPSGDGFLYGDGRHALRGRGEQVTWTAPGAAPITCTAAR